MRSNNISPTIGPSPRADATREALIEAAVAIFARDGFEAASTRAIAEEAGANQALIGYHFKGKRGLYLAVFEHLVTQLRLRVGDKLEALKGLAGSLDPAVPQAQEMALGVLKQFAFALIQTTTQPDTATWAQLILREQQAPSEAFEILYTGFMSDVLKAVTGLVQVLRPDLQNEEARILVVTIMGQMLALRMARAGVMRLLDWSVVTPERAAMLAAQVNANLEILLMQRP